MQSEEYLFIPVQEELTQGLYVLADLCTQAIWITNFLLVGTVAL